MTAVATSDESRAADAARDSGDLLLELTNISKRFPGVVALDGVDFDLRRGEVHVLFGENGAGKSTLINIIAGTYPADMGAFKYQGKEIVHLTPHSARVIGISPVFQEFSLVPELDCRAKPVSRTRTDRRRFPQPLGNASARSSHHPRT